MRSEALNYQVRSRSLSGPAIFMATYGVLWAISVELGVRIYAAEILAILCFLGLMGRAQFFKHAVVFKISVIYLMWVMAIVLSDLVNQTSIFDTLRAVSAPILGGLGFLVAYWAINESPGSALFFLIGISLAKAILGDPLYAEKFSDYGFSFQAIASDANYFKVRFEPFVTPAVLFLSVILAVRGLIYSVLLLLGVAIAYFALDVRASGLGMLCAASVCLSIELKVRLLSFRGLIIAGLLALLLYGSFLAYVEYRLESGVYGHGALQVSSLSNPYNPFELLLFGRSEWYAMPQAIYERPVFGWGSWARDEDGVFAEIRYSSIGQSGLSASVEGEAYIPMHSLIGSAWVWNGALAGGAMLWLLFIILSLITRLDSVSMPFIPVIVYFSIQLVWHFFFSPPQMVRIFFPVPLALLVWSGTMLSKDRLANTRVW